MGERAHVRSWERGRRQRVLPSYRNNSLALRLALDGIDMCLQLYMDLDQLIYNHLDIEQLASIGIEEFCLCLVGGWQIVYVSINKSICIADNAKKISETCYVLHPCLL